VRPVQKWQNKLIWDWKRCFGKTGALCWKLLRSGAPCAKMTKLADLRLKTLFCTNSCTFLKIVKEWCAQCKSDKLADLELKMLFGKTRGLWWKSLKSSAPSAKITKLADRGQKTLFCTNSYTFPKINTKVVHPLPKMRKRADLGLISLFPQTRALS